MDRLLLGLALGVALGALMARGSVCFNAGVRRAVFERAPTVLRVFAIAVAAQLLVLPLLEAVGVSPLEANVAAGAPALLPVAQLAGGLLFGVGMALAGGCITGIMWKAGGGSIATGLAIAGFAGGELLARGALAPVLADLDEASRPAESTLHGLLGLDYTLVAVVVGAIVLVALLARSDNGIWLGIGLGAIAAAAWLAAWEVDYGYGLGFTGIADNARNAIEAGDLDLLSLAFFTAIGVIAGGLVALRGPLRRPDLARLGRAGIGGVAMGVGANMAHGCNIGHGVTGVPLLSLGSLLAVAAMAGGALVTWRLALAERPALRGREVPAVADW